MIVQSWLDVLQQSFWNLSAGLVSFLPLLIFAIIVFIIGWIVGIIVGKFVAHIVRALKVDQALRNAGFEEVVHRAGYKLDSGAFVGALFKWFIIIAFLIASLEILDLSQVTLYLDQIVLFYLPQVIVAVLILLFTAVIGQVAQNIVSGSARAAGLTSAGVVGTLARWAIWIIGIIAALTQLGIAASVLNTLFMGIVVALALAFGLAFGLGGQESAARFLNRASDEMRSHHR
ncbi:MAG: mechanosensitive ion channel family protein [Minisyncoccia bacterium]